MQRYDSLNPRFSINMLPLWKTDSISLPEGVFLSFSSFYDLAAAGWRRRTKKNSLSVVFFYIFDVVYREARALGEYLALFAEINHDTRSLG